MPKDYRRVDLKDIESCCMVEEGVWTVPSISEAPGVRVVRAEGVRGPGNEVVISYTCDCERFHFRHQRCRHIHIVMAWMRRQVLLGDFELPT